MGAVQEGLQRVEGVLRRAAVQVQRAARRSLPVRRRDQVLLSTPPGCSPTVM